MDKVKLSDIKCLPSPILIGKQISKYDGHVLPDPSDYTSVVRALQYLTITRLDIDFVGNKLCQFFASLKNVHWQATKQVLRCLRGTLTHGLLLYKSSNADLIGFRHAN